MRRIVNPGGMRPKGYGVAWYEFNMDHYVCYPVPFNLIARWLRDTWYLMVKPGDREWLTPDEINKILNRRVEKRMSIVADEIFDHISRQR